MKNLNTGLKERTKLFKKIGPGIALEMSKALQKLSTEKIKVEFSSVRSFEQSKVFVDVGEKCFGSYVSFKSLRDKLEGIAVAIFPLSSTKTLTELLLKRFFRNPDKEAKDHKMKLSAFKEGVNILLLSYITGVANALKVKVEMGIPKFVSFRNIEFIKPALLRRYSQLDSLFSVGQFSVTSCKSRSYGGGYGMAKTGRTPLLSPLLKGALLLFFSGTFK